MISRAFESFFRIPPVLMNYAPVNQRAYPGGEISLLYNQYTGANRDRPSDAVD